jgi:Tfp pilus assembly protein PilO
MELMTEFIPIGGVVLIFIGGLIAVNKEIAKRPTFKETEERYKKTEVCDEIHKSVQEKLACLPEVKKSLTQIETKIDILLKNGKQY